MRSLECGVCLEFYNESNRIPRCLSCSHILCTSCIVQLMRIEPLKCPFCRNSHNKVVISSVDVPVHLALMSAVSEGLKRNDDSTQMGEEVGYLNVVELRTNIVKASEEGTCVYARLVTEDGRTRHAKVSLLDDRLHLHALKDNQLPNDSHVIPYDKIRALADEVHVVTFLEITLNGVVQGHMYIKLLDNAGRTCQFLYLCTGERGPSYIGTRFLEVTNKATPGEQIWGGDYENNDGSGGAALPDITRGPKNHQDVKAGLVAGFYYTGYDQDHNPSQFGIYTQDMVGYSEMSSLGKVLLGLQIIQSIAQLEDVHEAFVSDCGIVLAH